MKRQGALWTLPTVKEYKSTPLFSKQHCFLCVKELVSVSKYNKVLIHKEFL